MATDELASKLQRRNEINEGGTVESSPSSNVWNPYTEFKEFSRKEIQHFQKMFKQYDLGGDKFIDFEELKHMMEKLGSPQTHLGLKDMIREVDEDQDSKISFREFLLIFRKAKSGDFAQDSGLFEIYRQMSEVDVDKEGVKGAKNFFQAKIEEQAQQSKFEEEIRQEQEEKRIQEEERKQRRAEFKEKATMFQNL